MRTNSGRDLLCKRRTLYGPKIEPRYVVTASYSLDGPMQRIRPRATLETALTALGALFSFVPFVPRLVRSAFRRRQDRAEMLATLRSGLDAAPRDAEPTAGAAPRIFIVAGEPSGDLHAAD